MKTVAVIPVKGRLPLLVHSVRRLVNDNIITVCCGHTEAERQVVESAGGEFLSCHQATPLGLKWQMCIERARQHNPDGVLIMGSSDWICKGWCDILYEYLDAGYAMAGSRGFYFLDIQKGNKKRMYKWKGYPPTYRYDEPCGAGRLFSRKALEALKWEVFDPGSNSSLDYSSMKRLWAIERNWGSPPIMCSDDPRLVGVAISTYKWINKHKFDDYTVTRNSVWVNDPDTVLSEFFPEAINLFNE